MLAEENYCMRFNVKIDQAEDGWYVATVPSLRGCISQGKTREQAIENIKEAIKGYLTSLRKHSEPIPLQDEVVEIVA